MSQTYRLILMVISLAALVLIGYLTNGTLVFLNDFWFAAGLLMLILLSLVDQPHFSKDSNVFVNSVTAFMSLLLINSSERDCVFWLFFGIVIYLLVSSYSLMLLRRNQLSHENRLIQFVSRFNRIIGRPECLFSSFFIWGAIRQFSISSNQFNALLAFWIVFSLLNIPALASLIESIFSKDEDSQSEALGQIFGVQSNNSYLVQLSKFNCYNVKQFDAVEFVHSIDKKRHTGLVVDKYTLNQDQWVKVLCSDEIEDNIAPSDCKLVDDLVYSLDGASMQKINNRIVGLVVENSIIDRIKFIYNSTEEIFEGQLLELTIRGHKVLYQIVQGITKTACLEDKNETSCIIGEAIQLGEWDSEKLRFIQYGWVPQVNTLVYVADDIGKIESYDDDLIIGSIPGTNYPVILNKELAVTHHTAILGVTGSGKSVFARYLINKIASDTTKVIVVDITGEYKNIFPQIGSVISDQDADASFKAIELLAAEKAKFANQQDKSKIGEAEKTIKKAFYSSLCSYLDGDKNMAYFDIPDISNNSDILEYTRWFFWTLFKTVKQRETYQKRVCVVLEEAHTIVPELNSMGVSDFASKATVNAISQIALQGRKYNIGFIVIAQRTANVSKTILTQCNSIISFQELDKTSSDFLSNYISADLLTVLPSLKPRTAIAVGKAFRSTVPMIFSVPAINEKEYTSK